MFTSAGANYSEIGASVTVSSVFLSPNHFFKIGNFHSIVFFNLAANHSVKPLTVENVHLNKPRGTGRAIYAPNIRYQKPSAGSSCFLPRYLPVRRIIYARCERGALSPHRYILVRITLNRCVDRFGRGGQVMSTDDLCARPRSSLSSTFCDNRSLSESVYSSITERTPAQRITHQQYPYVSHTTFMLTG